MWRIIEQEMDELIGYFLVGRCEMSDRIGVQLGESVLVASLDLF